MRWHLAAVALLAAACGTPNPGMDAGVDSGVEDAGFDAGPAPFCLADRPDASVDAGTWDGGYDFSCRGMPRPGGGQGELVLSGITTRAGFMRTPMAGIQLDAVRADGTVMATTFSDDAGAYTLRFDAGCQPFDGEVRATSLDVDAGFAPAYALPEGPWRYDRAGLELVMFDTGTQGLAAALAGVALVDGTAALAMSVEDCAGHGVAGAVVFAENDAGDVRYVGASGLPSNMLSSTGPDGELIIFNAPGDNLLVTATLDGGVIAQKVMRIHPRAVTGTFLTP
ncbi:MAG: hypothetical protein JNM17_38190 [Archangium sp.]|nr:hypothetical protein [Archangium sp.]